MLWRPILTFAAVAGLAGAAFAATLEPLPGWVDAQYIDEALQQAKKKECPIVFLIGPREGRGVLSARSYMRHPGVEGMVKVLVIESVRLPSAFQRVTAQVQAPNEDIPAMYVATPELRILAFVESGSNRKSVDERTRLAKDTMAWINKSRANIGSAAKGVEAGRFGTALKTYQKIAEEDKERAVLTHKTWNVTVTKDEVAGFYFPDLPAKIAEVGTAAEARYDKAKEAFDRKDYAEARKLLFPMISDKCDLEAVKRATELFQKVEEALKQKP